MWVVCRLLPCTAGDDKADIVIHGTQFYLPEVREDPQKALTAFMADYGLICGASEAARCVRVGDVVCW